MNGLDQNDLKNLKKAVFSRSANEADFDKIVVTAEEKPGFFFAEQFKGPQVFHKHLTENEVKKMIFDAVETAGSSSGFRQIDIFCAEQNTSVLTSKKGKISIIRKNIGKKLLTAAPDEEKSLCSPVANLTKPQTAKIGAGTNRRKKYILEPDRPLLFLQKLGIMTKEGQVHAAKYDKFRQINRFLEYAADILPDLAEERESGKNPDITEENPLTIIDFGCGKAYLTFALYYWLNEIRKIPAAIIGLDLKKDVIADCSALAETCGFDRLHFECGDIAEYRKEHPEMQVDAVVTLHACDTATDFALAFAVEHEAKAILSVPCCQHELNSALGKHGGDGSYDEFLKYGIVKERFCALATDLNRAAILEDKGYKVQLLEFIDMEGTPKNLLIRAVKKQKNQDKAAESVPRSVVAGLGAKLTLEKLLYD